MEKEIDIYELKLNQELEKLQNCQKSKEIDSCLKCETVLNCEIRDSYVKALYEGMAKGEVGGFEF